MLSVFLRRVKRRVWRFLRDTKLEDNSWAKIAQGEEDKFYRLAACLIFKNEADYLKEWLDFHRLVGVEKFFLYNNHSEDEYKQVLAPYIAAGVVTLHDCPVLPPSAQNAAYNACLSTYRQHARWITFLDIDEFLYALDSDSILDVLQEYEDRSAVAVNWLMFGTSGHILKPSGLVIENFKRCQTEGNRHVRLIVNPLKTERMISAHEAIYLDEQCAVNEQHLEVRGPYSIPPSIARLRVNHYWTKSVEEFFLKKISRGDSAGVTQMRDAHGIIMAEKNYNNGEDHAIQRFVARVKSSSSNPLLDGNSTSI